MRNSTCPRSLALFLCFTLAYTSSANGFNSMVGGLASTLGSKVAREALLVADGYTTTPGVADLGTNPQAQPLARGGLWNADNIQSFADSYKIEAGLLTSPDPSFVAGGAGDTGDNQALVSQPAAPSHAIPVLSDHRRANFAWARVVLARAVWRPDSSGPRR